MERAARASMLLGFLLLPRADKHRAVQSGKTLSRLKGGPGGGVALGIAFATAAAA